MQKEGGLSYQGAREVIANYPGLGESLAAWTGYTSDREAPLSYDEVVRIGRSNPQVRLAIRAFFKTHLTEAVGLEAIWMRERLAWDLVE